MKIFVSFPVNFFFLGVKFKDSILLVRKYNYSTTKPKSPCKIQSNLIHFNFFTQGIINALISYYLYILKLFTKSIFVQSIGIFMILLTRIKCALWKYKEELTCRPC